MKAISKCHILLFLTFLYYTCKTAVSNAVDEVITLTSVPVNGNNENTMN